MRHQKTSVRHATEGDFVRFYGALPPQHWAGVVVESDRMIHAIGGVYAQENGVWCAWAHMGPGSRCWKHLHQGAKLVLDQAVKLGLPIYCTADPSIEASSRWLERLGFKPTGDVVDNQTVWKL